MAGIDRGRCPGAVAQDVTDLVERVAAVQHVDDKRVSLEMGANPSIRGRHAGPCKGIDQHAPDEVRRPERTVGRAQGDEQMPRPACPLVQNVVGNRFAHVDRQRHAVVKPPLPRIAISPVRQLRSSSLIAVTSWLRRPSRASRSRTARSRRPVAPSPFAAATRRRTSPAERWHDAPCLLRTAIFGTHGTRSRHNPPVSCPHNGMVAAVRFLGGRLSTVGAGCVVAKRNRRVGIVRMSDDRHAGTTRTPCKGRTTIGKSNLPRKDPVGTLRLRRASIPHFKNSTPPLIGPLGRPAHWNPVSTRTSPNRKLNVIGAPSGGMSSIVSLFRAKPSNAANCIVG